MDPEARRGENHGKVILLAALNSQREHILAMVDGLSEKDLRRPVLPSGWSCLGLVQHLALDVERFWFPAIVGGDAAAIAALPETDNAWRVEPGATAEEIIAEYRRQIGRANDLLAAVPFDAAPAWWPADLFGNWRLETVREIVVHVLVETAAHTGHLDAARELIDGRQWLVLTGEGDG